MHPTNHKLVSSLSGAPLVLGRAMGDFGLTRFTTAPGLEGSHHLPPYSSLYVTPPHLYSNGTFSGDSQGGVTKLSWFGLLGLWQLITPCSDLRLGWGLKQTCSFPWELFNGVSHSTWTHQGRVDSQLLVVGSQTASLTPGPSFVHNLCCRCLKCSCEAIFDIYASRPFQQYKEHLKARCFDPCDWALSFWESRRTPKSPFQDDTHTPSKWGCNKEDTWRLYIILQTRNLYGYAIKGMDDYLHFQRFSIFFQKVYTKWNILNKYAFVHFGWAWIPCHPWGNWTS